jgi:hypothetical protein
MEVRDNDDWRFEVLKRANELGFYGFSGKCGKAAVALNRELFNDEAKIVAILNRYLFVAGIQVYGHVFVDYKGTFWDAEGKLAKNKAGYWAKLDPNTDEYVFPTKKATQDTITIYPSEGWVMDTFRQEGTSIQVDVLLLREAKDQVNATWDGENR